MKCKLTFLVFTVLTISILACDRQVNQQGKRLYITYCASCHMENGEGLRQIVPALTDKDYLHRHREEIPCMIREGISGPMVIHGKEYDRQMPGLPELNNVAIHNIVNFVFQSWGNDIIKMNLDEVNRHLEECASERDMK